MPARELNVQFHPALQPALHPWVEKSVWCMTSGLSCPLQGPEADKSTGLQKAERGSSPALSAGVCGELACVQPE